MRVLSEFSPDSSLFTFGCLTVLEDSLHIEAVSGAGLVVGGALQVVGELPGSGVVDYPRVGGTDGILTRGEKNSYNVQGHSQHVFVLVNQV